MRLLIERAQRKLLGLVLVFFPLLSMPVLAHENTANQPPVNNAAEKNKIQAQANRDARNNTLRNDAPRKAEAADASQKTTPYGGARNRPRVNPRQQRLEEELRRMMNNLGCEDAAVQEAVLAFIRDETRARRPLVEQSRRLFLMLRTASAPSESVPLYTPNASPEAATITEPTGPLGGVPEEDDAATRPGNNEGVNPQTELKTPAVQAPVAQPSPAQKKEDEIALANQIEMYRVALEADRLRHKAAEEALDKKIKFTQNPRLEAMLLLMGIIGDSPNLPLRVGYPGGAQRLPGPRNNAVPENAPAEPAGVPVAPNAPVAPKTPNGSVVKDGGPVPQVGPPAIP